MHRRGDLEAARRRALRFRPEDGIEVIATGKLTTYPGRSRYQIVIERLELAGQGALMALLDKRRQALAAEGLFDAARKRRLPFAPRRDRRRHLADRRGDPRHPPPARGPLPDAMSSSGRCRSRARARPSRSPRRCAASTRLPDAVPARPADRRARRRLDRGSVGVQRGGGGPRRRRLARSRSSPRSATRPTPRLCDFAADVRAPTPTAAAEMAVPVRGELLAQVRELGARAERCARRAAERGGRAARRRCSATGPSARRCSRRSGSGSTSWPSGCRARLRGRLDRARGELGQAAGALRPGPARGRPPPRAASGSTPCGGSPQLAHPNRPLERGYARVEDRDGQDPDLGGGGARGAAAAAASSATARSRRRSATAVERPRKRAPILSRKARPAQVAVTETNHADVQQGPAGPAPLSSRHLPGARATAIMCSAR